MQIPHCPELLVRNKSGEWRNLRGSSVVFGPRFGRIDVGQHGTPRELLRKPAESAA
jgi:hypothetical protein